MRVLIVPLSAMIETAGSFSRAAILARDLCRENIEVAVCMAEDVNSKAICGVKRYDLSVPIPLGLPRWIGMRVFPLARKIGIADRKTVRSFEDVLYLTGNIDYAYLRKSIADIRSAIRDFGADVVYSEFNISAIVAAKLENRRLFVSASVPTQYAYAASPQYAGGFNRVLMENGLPPVHSCLELFSWAEWKFVPSCYELEPFDDENVVFCGSWKRVEPTCSSVRDKILVYMGNGTISQKKMLREVLSAFGTGPYSVYVAGHGFERQTVHQVRMAPYFDFRTLLPNALVFLNHGGQNSVIDGLIYGVPQIVCPGKVFERKYNADSLVKVGAGIEIGYRDFTDKNIKAALGKILCSHSYHENAARIGELLTAQGGTKNIIDHLKE